MPCRAVPRGAVPGWVRAASPRAHPLGDRHVTAAASPRAAPPPWRHCGSDQGRGGARDVSARRILASAGVGSDWPGRLTLPLPLPLLSCSGAERRAADWSRPGRSSRGRRSSLVARRGRFEGARMAAQRAGPSTAPAAAGPRVAKASTTGVEEKLEVVTLLR